MNISKKFKGVFVGVGLSAMLPFAAVGAASDRVVEISVPVEDEKGFYILTTR